MSLSCDGFGVGHALHFDLLAAHLIPQRLDVIASFPLNDHFFRDMNRLGDHRLLSRFGNLNSLVGPIDILYVIGIGDRASQNTSVFFMQGHLRFHRLFSDERAKLPNRA